MVEATEGRGCDLVIEATNSVDGIRDAALATRIGGRVVLVGIPDGNLYSPLPADLIRRKALSFKTSRRMGEVFNTAIELAASGYGARFPTGVCTGGCHWFPRLLACSKLEHECDQWHSSRVATHLTGCHCKSRPNTEGRRSLSN